MLLFTLLAIIQHGQAYAHEQSDSHSYLVKLNQVQTNMRIAQEFGTNKSRFLHTDDINFDPIQFLQENLEKFNVYSLRNIDDVNPKCLSQFERWFVALSNITNNPQQWAINGVNIFLLNLILISFKIFCFFLL